MAKFEPLPAAEYQKLTGNALRKADAMAQLAGTIEAGATVLIEEDLLAAVRTLASWGEQNG